MSTSNEGIAMSDQQHEDRGVEDLDVPTSDAEHVTGGLGIGKKLSPEPSLKIDLTSARHGWES